MFSARVGANHIRIATQINHREATAKTLNAAMFMS